MEMMPRPRLPHLRHEKNRHGEWCWYFRKDDGPRTRLYGAYGSKRFRAEYDAALKGEPSPKNAPVSGTLRWLVARYRESGKYTALKESTRRTRDNIFAAMLANADTANTQFVKLKRKHIERAMDKRASTPNAANNFLIVMRQMFEWAVANDHIKENPCEGVAAIKVRTDGFHSWTVAEVEKFRDRHPLGTKARLALDMLLYLGLRRSDVILAGRQHVKNEVLSLQTTKTGAWVHVPILPALRASIDATETGDLAFLTSAKGQPFPSGGAFGNWFKERCREAGIGHCSAHGLRKAGATMAADDGASERELMAMYGWGRSSTAEVYTKAADKKRLARAAAERIANANSPHLSQSAAESAKKNNGIN
jgi:integrase